MQVKDLIQKKMSLDLVNPIFTMKTRKFLIHLDVTHEDSSYPIIYDGSNASVDSLNKAVLENQQRKTINVEAKNFMLKLQEEAKKKYH